MHGSCPDYEEAAALVVVADLGFEKGGLLDNDGVQSAPKILVMPTSGMATPHTPNGTSRILGWL